jgi:nucleoside-diphosphate-sugar epimerase
MTTRAPLAAVTGANGFLGEALVEQLLARARVRALFRKACARSEAWRSRGCEIVVGDLEDDAALAALVADAAVVHHCAATLAKTDAALSHRVNVAGTRRLAKASQAAGVGRFVYVSSTSVYAATCRPDRVMREDYEPERLERLNNYSRTKYEGELAVREVARDTGLRFTIIRPTNIYGLRSGPWFRQWERLLSIAPVAIGDVPIDIVYVEDVADAMLAAAEAPAADGEAFNVGHEMVKMNRLIVEVGRVTGHRARVIPRAVDRPLCFAVDRMFRLITGSTLSPPLTRPVFYPHDKAARVFGYAPRFPLAAGFADLKRRYRQNIGVPAET